jgi:hypothetical protein
MDGPGNQFLAGSASPGHQHRGVEIGHAAHELIDALHLLTGADNVVAMAGLFHALLSGVQLLLQRGILVGPAEHGLEIANGRRAAAVTEGPGADQFKRCGAQAVVGHQDGGNIRCDQAPGAGNAFLKRIAMGG